MIWLQKDARTIKNMSFSDFGASFLVFKIFKRQEIKFFNFISNNFADALLCFKYIFLVILHQYKNKTL